MHVGQRIGRYTLQGILGRGGMGVVARARSDDGREVALKLLPSLSSSSRRRERFRREGEALLRLRHAHVVEVYEVGEHQGHAFLAMELVAGASLEERLARGGPLPVREAAHLIHELAGAVEHAHGYGILHRDLKPPNVIVTPSGKPVLVDFGLAGLLDDSAEERLTLSGAFLGTPGFWPPEQARGDRAQIGPRSDVYGLGATLYAALTGRPPQSGDSLQALAGLQPAESPRRLRPEIDPALEAICLRCLESEPSDRYPSARSLAEALAGYLSGPAPAPKGLRLAWPVSIVALAALVALGIVLTDSKRGRPQAQTPGPSARPTAADPLNTGLAAELAAHLARGDALLLDNDEDGAIAAYDAAIALDPECAAAWAGRGYGFGVRGERELALEGCERGVALDPNLGVAWSHYASVVEYMLGDLPRALELHDRALALDPSRELSWRRRSACRVKAGDLPGGLADLDRAIEVDPASVVCRSNRAHLLTLDGQIELALADLAWILTREPGRAETLQKRAWVYEQSGDLASAIADYSALIEQDPGRLEVWLGRSEARLQLGQVGEALSELDEALRRFPQQPTAWNTRGYARLTVLDDPRGSLADFTQAVTVDPGFTTSWINRATAKRFLGDNEGALADYGQALVVDPNDRRAWSNRGSLRFSLGLLEEALADFTRTTELAPLDPTMWDQRGVANRRLGHLDAALADYDRSLELAPRVAKTWRNRSQVHKHREDWALAIADLDRVGAGPAPGARMVGPGHSKRASGDAVGALADYDEALRLNPGFSGALAQRGRVHEALGDDGAALEDYAAALRIRPTEAAYLARRGLLLGRLRRPGAREDLEASLDSDPEHELADEVRTMLGSR